MTAGTTFRRGGMVGLRRRRLSASYPATAPLAMAILLGGRVGSSYTRSPLNTCRDRGGAMNGIKRIALFVGVGAALTILTFGRAADMSPSPDEFRSTLPKLWQ